MNGDEGLVSTATGPAGAGRGGWVISQLYYYLVAAAAVGLVVAGGIQILHGLREVVLPRAFESRHNGFYQMLQALALILPRWIFLGWNLQQARAREHVRLTRIAWPRALYFLLVSLFTVAFVYFGAITVLRSLLQAGWQACGLGAVIPIFSGPGAIAARGPCLPSHTDALRSALDGLVVFVVATAAWHWHLRQLRRETAGG